MSTSKELYDSAIKIVQVAVKTENSDVDALIKIGFEKEDLNAKGMTGRMPNYLYKAIGSDNLKVEVHAYAYDPTKPFSGVEPDINKFYVRIYDQDNKQSDEYSGNFQDTP